MENNEKKSKSIKNTLFMIGVGFIILIKFLLKIALFPISLLIAEIKEQVKQIEGWM